MTETSAFFFFHMTSSNLVYISHLHPVSIQTGHTAEVQYPLGVRVHHTGEYSLRVSLFFTGGHRAMGLDPYCKRRRGQLWSIQGGREGGGLLRQVVLGLRQKDGHVENLLQAGGHDIL